MKENRKLEYKEHVTNTFLKTVSAFSNYYGGQVIFGINDNGDTVGIHDAENVCLDIENKINDSINPQPDYELEVTEENTVILTVMAGKKKPYMYKSKAYKRNDTATIEVDSIELTRLILEGKNMNYEALPAETQNLTFEILEERLKAITGIDACDRNVLKTLNLYSDNGGFNIAAELLADSNERPGIDVGKFGDTISVIQNRKTFAGMSILSMYDMTYEMFTDYYQYEIVQGAVRETRDLIPGEAFREAIANALIHRVWDIKDNIRVLMFDDRIEVYSPGGLPSNLSEQEYLAGNYSKLRNPIISNVFYRLNIVEIFGTGIRRIRESYSKSISQPIFEVFENSIKIVLPVVKYEDMLNEEELIVYNALAKIGGKSISEVLEAVPYAKTKTRAILGKLISQELVEVTGKGRGTKYHKR